MSKMYKIDSYLGGPEPDAYAPIIGTQKQAIDRFKSIAKRFRNLGPHLKYPIADCNGNTPGKFIMGYKIGDEEWIQLFRI